VSQAVAFLAMPGGYLHERVRLQRSIGPFISTQTRGK